MLNQVKIHVKLWNYNFCILLICHNISQHIIFLTLYINHYETLPKFSCVKSINLILVKKSHENILFIFSMIVHFFIIVSLVQLKILQWLCTKINPSYLKQFFWKAHKKWVCLPNIYVNLLRLQKNYINHYNEKKINLCDLSRLNVYI